MYIFEIHIHQSQQFIPKVSRKVIITKNIFGSNGKIVNLHKLHLLKIKDFLENLCFYYPTVHLISMTHLPKNVHTPQTLSKYLYIFAMSLTCTSTQCYIFQKDFKYNLNIYILY